MHILWIWMSIFDFCRYFANSISYNFSSLATVTLYGLVEFYYVSHAVSMIYSSAWLDTRRRRASYIAVAARATVRFLVALLRSRWDSYWHEWINSEKTFVFAFPSRTSVFPGPRCIRTRATPIQATQGSFDPRSTRRRLFVPWHYWNDSCRQNGMNRMCREIQTDTR